MSIVMDIRSALTYDSSIYDSIVSTAKAYPFRLLKRRSDWQQAPHPTLIKSVLLVWRGRAIPATRSFTLFWGGEGKKKKTLRSPAYPFASVCW